MSSCSCFLDQATILLMLPGSWLSAVDAFKPRQVRLKQVSLSSPPERPSVLNIAFCGGISLTDKPGFPILDAHES